MYSLFPFHTTCISHSKHRGQYNSNFQPGLCFALGLSCVTVLPLNCLRRASIKAATVSSFISHRYTSSKGLSCTSRKKFLMVSTITCVARWTGYLLNKRENKPSQSNTKNFDNAQTRGCHRISRI